MKRVHMVLAGAVVATLAGCQSMALKSDDAAKRMEAVRSVADQGELREIALCREYRNDVRLDALARLESEYGIWRVWCENGDNQELAKRALDMIKDEDLLVRVALLQPYEETPEEREERAADERNKSIAGVAGALAANAGGKALEKKVGAAGGQIVGKAAAKGVTCAFAGNVRVSPDMAIRTNEAFAAVKRIRSRERLFVVAEHGQVESVRTKSLRRALSGMREEKFIRFLNDPERNYGLRNAARDIMEAETKSPALIYHFLTNETTSVSGVGYQNLLFRLADRAKAIKDPGAARLLLSYSSYWHYVREPDIDDAFIKNAVMAAKIIPAAERVGIITNEISRYSYRNGGFIPQRLGVAMARDGLDDAGVCAIAKVILQKTEQLKEECRTSFSYSWDANDRKMAEQLIADLPAVGDEAMADLLCSDKKSWRQIVGRVTEGAARKVLVSGKSQSQDLELELVKKLPANRLDMDVYNGAHFDMARKAMAEKMTPDMKAAASAAAEKALAAVVEKAKEASKTTFELDGFYLGMSFDDLKVVFSHHFPDVDFLESMEGEGDVAARVLYVAGQNAPFCHASVKDGKVWRLNFGKKLLRKWYDYDVQTFAEWAHAYGEEMKFDMRFKLVDDDTTVYEEDFSNSYRVWFHQESYQYRHNIKEYRIIYFGEEREYTVEGGLGGAIIKEMAAKDFRLVRGDPGSLRVVYARD